MRAGPGSAPSGNAGKPTAIARLRSLLSLRASWERGAWVFFLLAAGMAPFMAPANIALALAAACSLVWRWRARKAGEAFLAPFRAFTPVLLPIGAFVAWSLVSAVFSTLPSRSLIQSKGLTTFLLIPIAAALFRYAGDVDLAVDLWRIAALVLMSRGFWELFRERADVDFRLAGGLSSYMTFSGLLLPFALIFFARCLQRGGSPASRWFDLLVAVLSVIAVVLSLTRSAWLGLAAGLAALFFIARPKLLFLVPLLLAILFVAPRGLSERAFSIFDPSDDSARDRILMWKSGWAMVVDHPATGVGPGRVKQLYPEYRLPGYVMERPGHLHNNLVMLAAETGLPSLGCYLWFLFAFFRGALPLSRGGDPRRAALAAGAVASMVALFVAGLFEYNFGDVEVLRVTLLLSVYPFLPVPLRSDAPSPAPV